MTISFSNWVVTNPIHFKDAETRSLHGATFRVLPSPHSVPIAIRSVWSPNESGAGIEIKYLGEESTQKGVFADGVEIDFGRNSRRPRRIWIAAPGKISGEQLATRALAALESFQRVHVTDRGDDLRITLKVLRATLFDSKGLLNALKVDHE